MILSIEHVTKTFPIRGRGLFGKRSEFTALKDVNLSVDKGESLPDPASRHRPPTGALVR
jgi:peptide/nickel transport system ATP-binding protein